MSQEGLLIVISGPSGAGKGTVLKLVREACDRIRFSVSATTRAPRGGEREGINYFFKSIPEFRQMIQNEELIEWVEYCDNYYGTPKQYVDECLKAGLDVILEIEVEGALNIIKRFPHCVSIFILPPSFEELKNRIVGRGTEKAEVIEKRLVKAKKEMTLVDQYEYVVINDDINTAAQRILSILSAEKLRYERNKNILKRLGI